MIGHGKVKRSPQILPVLIFLGAGLFVLKAANVFVGVSAVEASIFFDKKSNITSPSSEGDDVQVVSVNSEKIPAEPEQVLNVSNFEVEDRILGKLGERQKALNVRETALDVREALLVAAEIKLDEKVAELQLEKEELKALEDRRKKAKSEELKAVTNAYERMKPRDAARIFELLEDDLLVTVAFEMRTQALSGVLAEMAPERARALTQLMANRNAATSTEQGSDE